MEETLSVSYVKCPFCTAKNHCAACGAELSQALAAKPGVESAQVRLPEGTVHLVHRLDRDTLDDVLDGMGLLTE